METTKMTNAAKALIQRFGYSRWICCNCGGVGAVSIERDTEGKKHPWCALCNSWADRRKSNR